MPPKSMSGRGLVSTAKSLLKSAHAFAKKEKILSKGLTHFGHSKAAAMAAMAGYGKRRRCRR